MGNLANSVADLEASTVVTDLKRALDVETERRLLAERKRDETARMVKQVVIEKDDIQARLDESLSVKQANIIVPKWTRPKTSKTKQRRGTPTIFLSDTHWSEVVNPDEINGYNAYSTDIATARLTRILEGTITVTDMISLNYDGIVASFGGDMFSGLIHRELDRTNDMEPEECIVFWTGQLVGFLLALADHYGKVHIPAFVGNHGRSPMDRKMPGKRRARTNQDWLLYQNVAMYLAKDRRFTWQIAEGTDVLYDVYDTTYLGYHGNDFSGGSGISGIFTPVMLGKYRTGEQYRAFGKTFNWMHIGHFHQHIVAKGLIVNGCFPAGSLVTTPNGQRPIETIEKGDVVLGGNGQQEVVSHVFANQSERGMVRLHVRGLPRELALTPNHLVWAIKGEATRPVELKRRHLVQDGDSAQWIPADFLSAGDWVAVPRFKSNMEERPISMDLAWLYGLFLAEGHTIIDGGKSARANRIGLSMHCDEVPVLEEAARIIAAEFPAANPALISTPRVHSAELVVNGREIAHHFRDLFGKGTHGKHVPAWFMTMAPELQEAVVTGWVDGDGHTRSDGVTSATTVSVDLATAMFYLSCSGSRYPSLSKLSAGGPRKSDSYTIHFNRGQEVREEDGVAFYRVANRFRSSEVVDTYDLEVTGEHTYVVEYVRVHNSMKGYDEFAHTKRYQPEVPSQALWITTPEHGMTFSVPIFCQDAEAEGWAGAAVTEVG